MSNYPHPIWRLTLSGDDITERLEPRLIDLSLTDNRGLEADELCITLSDVDGALVLPSRGTQVRLFLGWEDTGLIDKGTYTVDELEHSGAPDTLRIRARSANLLAQTDEKKERSWHNTTLGGIVSTIGKENALEAVISPDLALVKIAHIDQTDESDASFLTRLAADHDAIATIKDGRLIFYKIGTGKTFSGLTLERVILTRMAGDQHRFQITDRETAGEVKACWYDAKACCKDSVCVPIPRTAPVSSGKKKDEKPKTLTLRHACRNKQDALCRAKAAAERIARGVATFSLSLALGRPDLMPELPVSVRGFKPEIDGEDWLITKVSHRLSNSGLTTDLELELGLDSAADGGDADGADSDF